MPGSRCGHEMYARLLEFMLALTDKGGGDRVCVGGGRGGGGEEGGRSRSALRLNTRAESSADLERLLGHCKSRF